MAQTFRYIAEDGSETYEAKGTLVNCLKLTEENFKALVGSYFGDIEIDLDGDYIEFIDAAGNPIAESFVLEMLSNFSKNFYNSKVVSVHSDAGFNVWLELEEVA